MTQWTPEAIQLAFVREFSVNGAQLATIAGEPLREAARLAIWRNKRTVEEFYDSGMTYAEAYCRCYGQALDLRSEPRDAIGRPLSAMADDEADDDEEGAS